MKQRYTKLKSVAMAVLTMGLALGAQAEKCTDCITFSADESFKVRFMYRTSTPPSKLPYNKLEYSTDQNNWKTVDLIKGGNYYDGYEAVKDDDKYKIYFRGEGNTTFKADNISDYFHFSNTVDSVATEISCSGNIMTLLDWKTVSDGKMPEMGEAAFRGLFFGFRKLATAPDLPATNLTDYCYQKMFWDCRSLKNAPAVLPAKTLKQGCYNTMFQECSSLKTIPDMPFEESASTCCQKMFYKCSALEVNTNAPGRTWMVAPTNSATWNTQKMFMSTAGNITQKPYSSDPASGVTYYVASAPGTDLGGGVKAYDQGNGTYSVNGGESATLTKEMADAIKDKGVKNLVIGAGVTTVGEEAFSYWNGLKDVTIGDDVANLASNAFYHCTYVTNIVVGKGVGKVGPTAFDRCRSLESISFGSIAAAEAAQESYKVVARITMEGETPVVDSVPEVKINGYKKTLKGKEYLTDSEWQTVTTPLTTETPYHFFKYEYVTE